MRSSVRQINREFLETVDILPDHRIQPPLVSLFFNERRREAVTAISSFDGYKLVFSPLENENIGELVKRGLLFADIVILNHANIETEPTFCAFVVPAWFPKEEYTYTALRGKTVPPHMVLGGRAILASGSRARLADGSWDGVPATGSFPLLSENVAHWCVTEGRELTLSGQVMYCPLVPPASWEQYLYAKGLNFQSVYHAYRLLPEKQSYLDDNVARAIQRIDLPMMANVDLPTLQRIKEDERECFERFRMHMMQAMNSMDLAAGSSSFDRQMSLMNESIRAGIDEVKRAHRKIKKMRFIDLQRIAFISLPTILAAFVNDPGIDLLGPTLSLSQAAIMYLDHLRENIENKTELQENPMYLLWRISA
ncbi:MAG: hypothetical protein JW993_03710 [Sedimentisphaerales bacterium]|nr:hypothetical protein [Sedimentisphaerales bacterium]